MEQEDKSESFPWLIPLITLISLSTGIFLFFPQLTSSRPGGGDQTLVDKTFGDETIDARLWQDPLGVTTADAELMTPEGRKKRVGRPHSVEHFQKVFSNRCFAPYPWLTDLQGMDHMKQMLILAVMIPGGPYVEDVERRLRSRRAVIEALGSGLAHKGYDPERDHEIGYFSMPWPATRATITDCVRVLEDSRPDHEIFAFSNDNDTKIRPSRRKALLQDPIRYLASSRVSGAPTLLVPYEWYEPETFSGEPSHILVVWVTDDAFVDAPLARLADFISWFQFDFHDAFGGRHSLLPTFKIIGPDNSGTLHAMLKEAEERPWRSETRALLATTHIFSSQASAADRQLFSDIPSVDAVRTRRAHKAVGNAYGVKQLLEDSVKQLCWENGFAFDRTNLSDDLIVDALCRELARQGLKDNNKDNNNIAVISEEDTYYARALFSTFKDAVSGKTHPFNVTAYTYLRGIDGKLPSDKKESEESKSDQKNNEDSAGKTPSTSRRPTEQTEGVNQADDIRRLTDELKEQDETSRLKAIGLLGSDVYDKLEILKALRPLFPDAIFFTNHLDARFAHPDEWKETHNLIVASDYPLRWEKPHGAQYVSTEQKVGPFRDSGQTALYEATLEAIGAVSAESGRSPSIFEIGRNHLVRLDTAQHALKADFDPIGRITCAAALVGLLLTWIWSISRVKAIALDDESDATETETGES